MEELIQKPNLDELNNRGFTNRIQIHDGQTKETLLSHGFIDNHASKLYLCRMVTPSISFNMLLNAETFAIESIEVLDEQFIQPYNYQQMILEGDAPEMAVEVYRKVNQILDNLQTFGVITGFEKGMYI